MAEDLRAKFSQAAATLVPDSSQIPVIPEELLENDRIVQFLQWFCDDVHSTNILTADELTRCQDIESSGKPIQSNHLEEAVERMENFGCGAPEDLTTEQLRQEISDLQFDVSEARDHLDTLVQIKTQLDRHHADLLHEKDSIEASEKSYQQSHQRKLDACKKGNAKLNEGLEQLKCTIGDTMELYGQSDGELDCYRDDKPVEHSPFLSAYSLKSYHSMEENFTQALIAYTKKQFFQGIANLSDDDNDSGSVEELSSMNGDLKEMQRLQAVYPISEIKRINVVTEEQQLLAACMCAEKQIKLLSQANYNADDHDEDNVKAQITKLQEELCVVNTEIKKVGHEKLPVLVQEVTKLKFIGVCSTEHDLKLARQDYFTSKQDKVIDYLTDQLSRHQLLLMMYEAELRRHREVHVLLKTIQSQLTAWKDEHDKKIKLLQEMPHVSTAQPHQAISPMDTVSSCTYKLLEDSGMTKNTLVPTLPELLSSCQQLVNRVENLAGACRVLQIDKLQHTAQLQQMIFRYEELLKSHNVAVDGEYPVAISKELRDASNQLTASISKLEMELKQLLEELKSKKRTLATYPWLQKERELFVHFFTDPAKLQQVFSDLVTTVNAHSLLQSKATV